MRVIRSQPELAALWTCPGFIPAFHMVYGQTHAEQARRYDQIVARGALLPSRTVGSQNMYFLDRFAGDDQYIFLSPVRPAQGLGSTDFGFVFDASDLVRAGAVVGEQDLLQAYLIKVIDRFSLILNDRSANDLGSTLEQRVPQAIASFEAHIKYLRGKFYDVPTIEESWQIVKEAVDEVAAQRYRGRTAERFLAGWAKSSCRTTRMIIQLAADHVRLNTAKFQSWFTDRIKFASPDDTPYQLCAQAARNTVATETTYLDIATKSPPELLWPGALRVDDAKAVIELPKPSKSNRSYGGFDWPDDLFYASCPVNFNPAIKRGAPLGGRRRLAGHDDPQPVPERALRFMSF